VPSDSEATFRETAPERIRRLATQRGRIEAHEPPNADEIFKSRMVHDRTWFPPPVNPPIQPNLSGLGSLHKALTKSVSSPTEHLHHDFATDVTKQEWLDAPMLADEFAWQIEPIVKAADQPIDLAYTVADAFRAAIEPIAESIGALDERLGRIEGTT
jgi:hypothetical protein